MVLDEFDDRAQDGMLKSGFGGSLELTRHSGSGSHDKTGRHCLAGSSPSEIEREKKSKKLIFPLASDG